MKVNKVVVAKTDLISQYLPGNYKDAFEYAFYSNHKITADDFMIAFWTNSPGWVEKLFALRDWMVKPFGIQTGSGRSRGKLEEAVRTGGSYGFMSVVAKSDTETVISADDKHLKMYFSVKIDDPNDGQKKLTISTIVHFNNWLGYVYFYLIYPFHLLIVPNMVKYSLNKLLGAQQ